MSTATTKELSDWLEKLGMSEYAQRFVENDVDISVLPHFKAITISRSLASRSAIGERCWPPSRRMSVASKHRLGLR